jgi:hypothetical protein
MLRLAGLVTLVGVFCGAATACSDEDKEVLQCCMLKRLAVQCTPTCQQIPITGAPPCPAPSQSLLEDIQQWRQVGNNGNGDACKALIDSANNGCSGSIDYDEQDAIVDCQ